MDVLTLPISAYAAPGALARQSRIPGAFWQRTFSYIVSAASRRPTTRSTFDTYTLAETILCLFYLYLTPLILSFSFFLVSCPGYVCRENPWNQTRAENQNSECVWTQPECPEWEHVNNRLDFELAPILRADWYQERANFNSKRALHLLFRLGRLSLTLSWDGSFTQTKSRRRSFAVLF